MSDFVPGLEGVVALFETERSPNRTRKAARCDTAGGHRGPVGRVSFGNVCGACWSTMSSARDAAC